MSGFFWNICGLNKIRKHHIIRDWLSSQKFQFGSLLETRVQEGKSQAILSSIFPGWLSTTNYDYHRLGRIWVLWRPDTTVSIIFKSSQLITCTVKLPGMEETFICSFIYASNIEEERRQLWTDLRSQQDNPQFKNFPWILSGDFNEILHPQDHSNAPSLRTTTGMRDFEQASHYCCLTDLLFHGPRLTWSNKQEGRLIYKKLDRILVNDSWLNTFPSAYSVFESGGCSDHLRGRIMLNTEASRQRKNSFKFVNAVTNHHNFLPSVEQYWNQTTPLFVSTTALFRLSKKLKKLKPLMKSLGKDLMADLTKRTQEAFKTLCEQQAHTLSFPSTEAAEMESIAYSKWLHLSDLEEVFLKQKSKLHWLKVGDRNNRFFHQTLLLRKMRNSIREIQGSDGLTLTKHEDIKAEAVRYFSNLLNHKPSNYNC